jgi:hypothetical protein
MRGPMDVLGSSVSCHARKASRILQEVTGEISDKGDQVVATADRTAAARGPYDRSGHLQFHHERPWFTIAEAAG